MPEKETVTATIEGIDIMELEDAVRVLWKENIYAESGMGCTGPIIMVNEEKNVRSYRYIRKSRICIPRKKIIVKKNSKAPICFGVFFVVCL